MIPHGLIIDRIQKLAVDIINAYDLRESGIRITMLCILKGGHQFFSDLCNVLKQLTLTKCKQPPLTFDFIRVKSYAGTESSGAENTKIESIGVDLAVSGVTPKLFLPGLAGLMQGPGFPNLSCLGLLSDRVLGARYPRRAEADEITRRTDEHQPVR